MHHFIVIGNPISHSKSPQIHTAFAQSLGLDISYQRQFCPDNKESFNAVVEAFFHGGGTGANITLPFKEHAFRLCQSLSDNAKTAKAVNTLMLKDGKLHGDNTDGQGLVGDLLTKGVKLQGASVAILGAGGATRGAVLPLLNAGANLTIFNRTLAKAQELISDFDAHLPHGQSIHALPLSAENLTGYFDVIINATSASTTGQTLPLATSDVVCGTAYDMMYGKQSQFLEHFKAQNAQCFDGFGMLIGQAKLSFEQWTGESVDLSKVDLSGIL